MQIVSLKALSTPQSICIRLNSPRVQDRFRSQLPLRPYDLPHHEVLMPTDLLTRNNHHQIPIIAHLVLIMRHEFLRKRPPLSVFGNNFVPIHGNIDCLLHLGTDNLPHESTTGVATGWIVDEVPSWNGGHIGQLCVGHFS